LGKVASDGTGTLMQCFQLATDAQAFDRAARNPPVGGAIAAAIQFF